MKKIQKIKLIVALLVVLVIALIMIRHIIIYQKEGEKNMPYSISKVIVISTANKYEKKSQKEEQSESNQSEENVQDQNSEESDKSIWKFDVIQTNDFYISIQKNEENIKKDEKIKTISIENIKIENPQKGTIKAFMPNSVGDSRYNYSDEYIVENSLTYRGAPEGNFQNLQISENGGVIGISFSNIDLEEFASGDDTEITYNGTMLAKLGIADSDLKSKITFDLIIELDDGKKYKGTLNFEINCEGLIENGTSKMEITDFSNVIFKRI